MDTESMKLAGHLTDTLIALAESAKDPAQRTIYERMSTEAADIWRGLKDGDY